MFVVGAFFMSSLNFKMETNMIINLTETNHFRKRCRQRGIKKKDVETIINYADIEANVGNGVISYSISNKSIYRIKEFFSISQLERIKGKAVLISEDGNAITVLKIKNSKSFHYRKGVSHG